MFHLPQFPEAWFKYHERSPEASAHGVHTMNIQCFSYGRAGENFSGWGTIFGENLRSAVVGPWENPGRVQMGVAESPR